MLVPILTLEQQNWVNDKLEVFDCIYVGIHGSWLYGLAHEKSDIDVKAIYLPSKRELILGGAVKTYNYKNEELDIEIEVKSLSSFLKSAASCDTNSIDLLHSPEEMCISKTELWDNIVINRSKLYAKNMKGLVGYVKTHSKKYTNKIDRLQEMELVRDFCVDPYYKNKLIGGLSEDVDWKYFRYVKSVKIVEDHEQKYLEVCGKKYIYTWEVSKLLAAMNKEIARYGKRSKQGLDIGIDTKSLSHALRVLYEMKEIIETKDLKFPLKEKDFILKVKKVEVTDLSEILDKIDTLYDEVTYSLENSDLPEDVDLSSMYTQVENYYFG